MRILIADDDPLTRLKLETILRRRGHEVIVAQDGEEAWQVLQTPEAPPLAILDWVMPGLDGVDICRKARAIPQLQMLYLILLTGQSGKQRLIEGLEAGANDYVTKPFDPDELHARVRVGLQMVRLHQELARRVRQLEDALGRVQTLQGLLPICCYCKKIRDDRDYWHQVESYIGERCPARFTHGICPTCFENVVKPEMAALKEKELRPDSACEQDG
jgi:sigma-B regulation protein RsbU (phosphoserine phosphatase)